MNIVLGNTAYLLIQSIVDPGVDIPAKRKGL